MVEINLIDEIFDVKAIKKQAKDVEDIVTSLKDSLKKTADQLLQLSKNANFDTNLKSIEERQKQIIELSGKASKAIDELTKKEREREKLIERLNFLESEQGRLLNKQIEDTKVLIKMEKESETSIKMATKATQANTVAQIANTVATIAGNDSKKSFGKILANLTKLGNVFLIVIAAIGAALYGLSRIFSDNNKKQEEATNIEKQHRKELEELIKTQTKLNENVDKSIKLYQQALDNEIYNKVASGIITVKEAQEELNETQIKAIKNEIELQKKTHEKLLNELNNQKTLLEIRKSEQGQTIYQPGFRMGYVSEKTEINLNENKITELNNQITATTIKIGELEVNLAELLKQQEEKNNEITKQKLKQLKETEEVQKEIAIKQQQTIEDYIKSLKDLENQQDNVIKQLSNKKDLTESDIKSLEQQQKAIENTSAELTSLIGKYELSDEQMDEVEASIANISAGYLKMTDSLKDAKYAMENAAFDEYLDNEIAKIHEKTAKQKDFFNQLKETGKVQKENSENTLEELNNILKSNEEQKKEIDILEDYKNKFEDKISQLKSTIAIQEAKNNITEAEKTELEKQKEVLSECERIYGQILEKTKEIKALEISKVFSDLANNLPPMFDNIKGSLNALSKAFENFAKDGKMSFEDIANTGYQVFSMVGDMINEKFNMQIEAERARIDQAREDMNVFYDEQQQALDNATMSEERRAEMQAELNRQRFEKEKEINQQEAELNAKSAEQAKNMAITDATIQMILGSIMAWKSAMALPFPFSLAAGAILQTLIATTGAMAIARAKAMPIPAYEKGTEFAKGGVALVAEKQPELGVSPKGKKTIYLEPQIVNLERGTKIIPNLELAEKRGYIPAQPNITTEKHTTNVNIDSDGIAVYASKYNERRKYINRKLNLSM